VKWLLVVVVVITAAAAARAECPKADRLCWDVSVPISPTAVDLKTGAMLLALPLGVCIGATYQPWVIGADFCLNAMGATKADPNTYLATMQVKWRLYGAIGAGALCRQKADEQGLYCHAIAFVAARVPVAAW
jgi:hypothetical protein